ncbi:cation:proton antiporter [Candidatus Woesearchaeota archaeon]|nr:cation:proton antiporter [Candidatus Woesearchaeota archaeon]
MSTSQIGILLIKLVIIILAARLFGYLAEKIKQPAVLGELIAGVLLGPSLFNIVHESDPVLNFLSNIGVIILLFIVGLESNIYHLLKVGRASFTVACIGVVVPFFLGYFYFIFNGYPMTVAMLVGGTLTATSVGITMRVLSELGKTSSEEGKIILGAAVIDDVLGLIVLAVVIGIVTSGHVSLFNVFKLSAYSILFLVGSIYLGIKFVPVIYKIVHKLELEKTFVISAFVFALALAIIANWIGLATIVGSFAAGLILERTEHKEHFQERMKPVADLFVPIFFVMAGALMNVKLFNLEILLPILTLTVIAIVGKIVAGIGAYGTKASKFQIGLGMIPRGEVGLIFATYGLTYKIVSNELYSILVIIIMLTTFVTPPLLAKYMKKGKHEESKGIADVSGI